MRATAWMLVALATFIGLLGGLYWHVSGYEPIGSWLLGLTSLLASIIATYLLVVTNGKRQPPEDRRDGSLAEGAGVLGYFSPASIWPFLVGIASAVLVLGVAYGALPFYVGLGLLAITGFAMLAENWRR